MCEEYAVCLLKTTNVNLKRVLSMLIFKQTVIDEVLLFACELYFRLSFFAK